MKVAVTANQPNLESEVDPRFGRCRYFVLVDPDTLQFETVENESAMAGGGAGVSTAQAMVSRGVKTILTGNCGPNAHQVLSAAGINVITGVSGTVSQAIQNFKSGQYQASAQPNVADHFGSPGGRGGHRHGQTQ